MRDTKQQLVQTMKVTRRKPIPIRQQSLLAAKTTTTTTSKMKNSKSDAHGKKKSHHVDTSGSVANGSTANPYAAPPTANPPSTETTKPISKIIVDVEPVQEHDFVTLGEDLLAQVSEFTDSVPNDLFNPEPHLLDASDTIECDVYEI